jgi:uncharacterized damage-inducible protein DinB
MEQKLEVWQRGPVDGVPPLLQPVAHALLQAKEETASIMQGFDDEKLWTKPSGMASAGFHLQHMRGVIDRLFTYALGNALTQEQLLFLSKEGLADDSISSSELIHHLAEQINKAIEILKATKEQSLTEWRGIGRKQLPTNVMGLMFHAAEHTMRHMGQLLVTVKMLAAGDKSV